MLMAGHPAGASCSRCCSSVIAAWPLYLMTTMQREEDAGRARARTIVQASPTLLIPIVIVGFYPRGHG